MSSPFPEYNAPIAPIVRKQFSFQDLVNQMHTLTPENVPFVGGIYGEAGTGKTTTAMRLMHELVPDGKMIIFVYTGKNWTSLMNEPRLMDPKKVRAIRYESYDQLESLGQMFANKEAVEKLNLGGVVFDEYNTMFDIDLDAISAYRAAEVNAQGKMKDGVRVYKDPDTPEWPEYNTAKARLVNLMNNVLMGDLHFLFVCHPRKGNKSKKIEPDFPDKSAQAFLRSLNSLYYLENSVDLTTNKIDRKIVLQGAGMVTAKNRIGGLPDFVRSIDPIVEAYRKWGVPEKEESVPTEVATVPVEAAKPVVEESPAPIAEEKVSEEKPGETKGAAPFADPFAGILGK